MSSRGYETDLIESICECIALSSHIEEVLKDENNDDVKEMLKSSLGLRRKQMSRLLEMADNPNPKFHCIVKHSLGAWWRQMEVWEATLDEEDYILAKELGDLSAMCLSKYLGLEFETCQRCLYDSLMTKEYEKSHYATMEANEGEENGN